MKIGYKFTYSLKALLQLSIMREKHLHHTVIASNYEKALSMTNETKLDERAENILRKSLMTRLGLM